MLLPHEAGSQNGDKVLNWHFRWFFEFENLFAVRSFPCLVSAFEPCSFFSSLCTVLRCIRNKSKVHLLISPCRGTGRKPSSSPLRTLVQTSSTTLKRGPYFR